MAMVISLFNHKGGVSKTTTTFHLGWMLTKLGQKVLIVDADPQCNLTGLVLGINDYDALFDFYATRGNYDIYNSLAEAFGFPTDLKDASMDGIKNPTQIRSNPNMSIIAGHIDFAKFDLQIATALTSSQSIPRLKPLLGSINNLIRKTANIGNFDVVLVDMSPNISATNMCIFMASDYFIIPTSPDFFCYQSIESLSNVLPRWSSDLATFKDGATLPKNNPKMLGTILQNYRVYDNSKSTDNQRKMTKGFTDWSNKIKEITNGKLAPALKDKRIDMIISEETFKKYVNYDSPYNLANIQDFNSLIPISQRVSKPMFELTQEDVAQQGSVWENTKSNIERSHTAYEQLAKAIAQMIGLETADKEMFDSLVSKASKPV